MSPLYVRPYVKVHKNDDRDAEAIAEAATRPTMSFVAIKSEEQLDLQALLRAREYLVSDRTHLINQGCGFSDGAWSQGRNGTPCLPKGTGQIGHRGRCRSFTQNAPARG